VRCALFCVMIDKFFVSVLISLILAFDELDVLVEVGCVGDMLVRDCV